MPKNLRSFLCITVVWLCHPQLALWAWQTGHPESSAVPAGQTQSSPAPASASSLPDVPDADELPRLEPVPGPGKTLIPVHIAANTQRKDGAVYTLLGDVEIRYKDYVLHADKMNYNEDTGEARAEGHVELDGGPADEHILADHATMNLNLDTGRFYNVTGSVGVRQNVSRKKVIYTTTNPFLFTGRVVIKNGPDQFRVISGTMTSCRLPHPDWVIAAGRIDMAGEQASARNAIFRDPQHPDRLSALLHASGHVIGPAIRLPDPRLLAVQHQGQRLWRAVLPGAEPQHGRDFRHRLLLQAWLGAERRVPFSRTRRRLRRHPLHRPLRPRRDRATAYSPTRAARTFSSTAGSASGAHTRLVSNAEYLSSIIYREAFADTFSQATATQVNSNIYITHNANGISETGSFNRYINYAQVTPFIEDVVIAHLPIVRRHCIGTSAGRNSSGMGRRR